MRDIIYAMQAYLTITGASKNRNILANLVSQSITVIITKLTINYFFSYQRLCIFNIFQLVYHCKIATIQSLFKTFISPSLFFFTLETYSKVGSWKIGWLYYTPSFVISESWKAFSTVKPVRLFRFYQWVSGWLFFHRHGNVRKCHLKSRDSFVA